MERVLELYIESWYLGFYYWYIVKLDLFWLKNFIWFVFVFKKILLKVSFMWIKYRFSNIFYVIINKSILKKLELIIYEI